MDWCVKTGICLIEQFAVHITELHSCHIPSHKGPPMKALVFLQHSANGEKLSLITTLTHGPRNSYLRWWCTDTLLFPSCCSPFHVIKFLHIWNSVIFSMRMLSYNFFLFMKLKYKPMNIFYIEEEFRWVYVQRGCFLMSHMHFYLVQIYTLQLNINGNINNIINLSEVITQ